MANKSLQLPRVPSFAFAGAFVVLGIDFLLLKGGYINPMSGIVLLGIGLALMGFAIVALIRISWLACTNLGAPHTSSQP